MEVIESSVCNLHSGRREGGEGAVSLGDQTSTERVVTVCDEATGTTGDILFNRLLPLLPSFLSLLKHFYSVLGAALLEWIILNRNTSAGDPKRNFVGLLDVMQTKYQEEESNGSLYTHQRTTSSCQDCQERMIVCVHRSLEFETECVQTETDDSFEEESDTLVKEGEDLLQSLVVAGPSHTAGQSSDASSSSDGPEEFPENDNQENMGAVGGTPIDPVPQNPEPQSSTQLPETEPHSDEDSDGDVNERTEGLGDDAAAEELRHLTDEGKCKVCLEREMDVVLLPCGHFITCSVCAARVRNCPACREIIQATLAAYRA